MTVREPRFTEEHSHRSRDVSSPSFVPLRVQDPSRGSIQEFGAAHGDWSAYGRDTSCPAVTTGFLPAFTDSDVLLRNFGVLPYNW